MSWTTWVILILSFAYVILLIGEICRLVLENRNPVRTLAWLITLVTLPFIGIFLFYNIGLNYRKRKIFNKKGLGDLKWLQDLSSYQRKRVFKQKILQDPMFVSERKLMMLLLNNSKALITSDNTLSIYSSGNEAFEAIFSAITGARRFIHIEFYIVEEGELADKLKTILLNKLSEGVEVRFIYDDVGSWNLSKEYLEDLKSAGAKIFPFLPLKIHRRKANYRNHRKIVIVDGDVAFMGGVNIADRYVYGSEIGKWRDTLLQVKGESVSSLQMIFLTDWYFVCQESLINLDSYYSGGPFNFTGNSVVQVISSGPDSDWDSIRQAYISLVNMAEKYVYISTPYFMPGEPMLNALKIAAMSGVEVRIMIPYRSDVKLAYWCSRSFIKGLLDAGVRAFMYLPGINHSKVISVDGKLAAIGSANVDLRSLDQNFEVSMIIYDSEVVSKVESDYLKDIEECQEVHDSEWSKRSHMDQIKESFSRLFAPIL